MVFRILQTGVAVVTESENLPPAQHTDSILVAGAAAAVVVVVIVVVVIVVIVMEFLLAIGGGRVEVVVSTPNRRNIFRFLYLLVAVDNYYMSYKFGFREPKR